MNEFKKGLRAGIPIGLGYLSVSFSFGIMAISAGLYWWQALLISMLTLTSAGQLAGITIMTGPGRYVEMLTAQTTINIRYSFMSISLSQKVDSNFKGIYRWLLGFFITDEIFAVASMRDNIKRSYVFGLAILPYFGWATGTLMGALIGNVLPDIVLNSLCIAIYGMFIAIIAPIARKEKNVFLSVLISVLLSVGLFYIPYLNKIPTGLSISISSILSAIIVALIFPVKEELNNGD